MAFINSKHIFAKETITIESDYIKNIHNEIVANKLKYTITLQTTQPIFINPGATILCLDTILISFKKPNQYSNIIHTASSYYRYKIKDLPAQIDSCIFKDGYTNILLNYEAIEYY